MSDTEYNRQTAQKLFLRSYLAKLKGFIFPIVLTSLIGVFIASVSITYAVYQLGPLSLKPLEDLSVVVVDRRGRLLRPFATREGLWRLPVRLQNVDPKLINMLLAYEDKRFYSHYGFDPLAFSRAAWQFISNGRIISGGSTITMQVARLLEGRPTRSFKVKFIQIVRAIQLEQKFTKDQILQMYFTLAPYGGNIEGVRAASLAYFGKEPKRLSLHEAALLVALPQAPTARRPDRSPKSAQRGRNRVLTRMQRFGILSAADVAKAKGYPVPTKRQPFPLNAAHLADIEVAKHPLAKKHKLTVDRGLQASLEKLAAEHVRSIGPKLSTAVLVADHKNGDILAYLGSAGYLNQQRFGAIDMVQATRSPGSALKPFVYGLAFDAGIAHPETLIEDRPIIFSDYAPENFDKIFRGTLSMRQALQASLNVPVVKLLNALGPARLVARFRMAGLQSKIPRNLSIALGGVGVKLQELAQLYSALPRGGEPVRFHYKFDNRLKEDNATEQKQNPSLPLLSKNAAWYVADILKGVRPPKNAKGGMIAFKTGTSYGHRDAWSVGFDGRHVVAVWVGRPDNTATPGLLGLSAAAPLLFDTFQRISPKRVPLPSAPHSVLQTTTAKLPPPLQHFDKRGAALYQEFQKDRLRIAFPPNKAELELLADRDGKTLPLALKAKGGKLPLTWLVDGKPITSSPHRRQVFWRPKDRGFVRFTVIDSQGAVDRIAVRLQ